MGRMKTKSVKAKRKKIPKGRNSKYRNYDIKDVEEAFKEVMEKHTSVRSAAINHGIPASTLRDRIHGKIKILTSTSGPAPFMAVDDEKVFVKQMMKLKAIGYRYRQSDIANAAADYGHYFGKRDIAEGPMSRGWIKKFVDRQKKKITSEDYRFSSKVPFPSFPIQKKYYEELDTILIKHNLKDRPHLIYNLTETALNIDDDCTGPEATIVSCVNALGLKLPPFFIFKGRKPNAKLTKGGPDGLGAVMSESGGPNSRIMQHYLKDHFLKNLEGVEEDEDTHVLLLYDGHQSRVLFPVVKWALEHKIIMFVIPPHCSCSVNPYNIANFNPMDICYKKERSAFLLKHSERSFDRFAICRVASRAYEKVFAAPAVIASFHEAGIFPFKPKMVTKPPQEKDSRVMKNKQKKRHHGDDEGQGPRKKKAKRSDLDAGSSEEDDLSDFLSDSSEEEVEESKSQEVSEGSYGHSIVDGIKEDVVVNGNHGDLGEVVEEVLIESEETGKTCEGSTLPVHQTVEVGHVSSGSQVVQEVGKTVIKLKDEVPNKEGDDDSMQSVGIIDVHTVESSEDLCSIADAQNDEVQSRINAFIVNPTETSDSTSLRTEFPDLTNLITSATKNVQSKSSPTTSTLQTDLSPVSSGVEGKQEYMLIKPRSAGDQCAGQLVRVQEGEKSSGSSVTLGGTNIVIKVIEVSQETYDQVMQGGDVVLGEQFGL